MGIFEKFFKKEPKTMTLNYLELKEWLEEISHEILKDENKKLQKSITSLKEIKEELNEKLNDLAEAELLNPNIPLREKHIMEGNRTNFIKNLISFEMRIPEVKYDMTEKEYDLIEKFSNETLEKIKEINEQTKKGYYILKNFYEKEVQAIAFLLKKTEQNLLNINELINKGKISDYRNLIQKIRELNEVKLECDRINSEISSIETEINESEKKQKIISEKIEAIKRSQDYLTYVKMENEKAEISKEISNLNSRLKNLLMPYEKGMKKMAHKSIRKELIEEYLTNPLEALVKDKERIILSVLLDIKKNTKNNTNNIREIKNEDLDKILLDYQKISKDKEIIEGIINRSTIMMEIKDLEYQNEHISEKISTHKKNLNSKKEKLSSLQLLQKAKKLEKMLSDFSGYIVSISS